MSPDKTVNVIIDGCTIEVSEDVTILQAARSAGITIPSLCYMNNSGSCAACQICCVEVIGMNKLMTACSTRVFQGMNVRTDSEKVIETRKRILEMILASHEKSCDNCGKVKNCSLRKWEEEYGINLIHSNNMTRYKKKDGFDLNESKCVLCMKCVTVCREMAKKSMLTPLHRGLNTTIAYYGDHELCSTCKKCEKICPVNAINIK